MLDMKSVTLLSPDFVVFPWRTLGLAVAGGSVICVQMILLKFACRLREPGWRAAFARGTVLCPRLSPSGSRTAPSGAHPASHQGWSERRRLPGPVSARKPSVPAPRQASSKLRNIFVLFGGDAVGSLWCFWSSFSLQSPPSQTSAHTSGCPRLSAF